MSPIIGDGPDLALIHGWGLGGTVWQPLLEPLSQCCRVHLLELPGYGQEPDDASDFTAAAQALIAALPAGVTLCGWSLGAMLAMRAASLSPDRVGGLILVGATARFTQCADWPAAQAPAVLEGFAAGIRRQPTPTLQRFALLLSQGDSSARSISRKLLALLRQHPTPEVAALRRGLDWLGKVDLRPLLPAIATRCLLVHGEHDPLNPIAAAQYLSTRLPNARLEVFNGAAHAPFLADPARFVRLLGEFCNIPPDTVCNDSPDGACGVRPDKFCNVPAAR